jgi:O-antigen/teichoic acid export membrane protein
VNGSGSFSFRPAMQLMAGRLFGFVATFFVPIVLVRLFSPELFGTYKQIFLVYGTLFALAQLGMAESLFYFLPQERDDADARAGYQVNALLVLALSGAVALAALTFGAERIAWWLNNPELAQHLPLLGVYLLLTLSAAGLEITLLCRQRFVRAAAVYAISDLVRAALLVLPVLLFESLGWMMAGAIAFAGVRLLVHLLLLRRAAERPPRPSRRLLARQLAYSLPFQIAVILEVAHVNLHQYAVSYWYDPATFAIYAVGCLQIPLVDFAASSAGNVLMVGMGDARSRGDAAAAREIWLGTTRRLALLLFPLVVVLVLVASDLIPFLFTDEYRGSIGVFVVWTSAVALSALQTDSALRVYAAVRTILLLNLVRLTVVAGLIAWAVAIAGLVGAVAATVLATAVAKALALLRLRRLLDVSWSALLPWKELGAIAAASMLAAVPAAFLRAYLDRGEAVTLAVLGLAYVAVLLPLLGAFGLVKADELPAPLRRALRTVGRRVQSEPSKVV